MNSSFLKKALPHILAVLVFLIVSIVYCKPALDGKVVHQADVLGWKGMAQQSLEYKDKYGHFPLWTESTFSGMPAYNIAMSSKSNITVGYLSYLLTWGLPAPISYFFIACLCFYILTQVLRINPWIGILAAIAYAWSSYDPVIIVVGHVTKMQAIGYAPGVIAGLLLIFQRKYLWGAVLFALFISFQVGTQHMQVVYYTMLNLGLLTIAYLVYSWKQKDLQHAFIAIAIAAGAAVVGYATLAMSLLPVQEYVKETMRGGRTELTNTNSKLESKNGLNRDYAFTWSYGMGETFTLMVPHIFGGGSDGRVISDNSKFADKLAEDLGVPEDNGLQIANGNAYWGAQEGGTSGTVYLGAIICFLFILGIIFVPGWQKWWLVSVAALGIILAWGKNFPVFNNLMFEYFPYYNKFRAPTIALVMPQLAFPLLGALGLHQLLNTTATKEEVWKKFKLSVFVTGGILILLAGYYFTSDYKGARDAQIKQQFTGYKLQQLSRGGQPDAGMQQQAGEWANSLLKALHEDRQSVFGSDLLRTIVLIAAAVVLMGLYLKGKVKPVILLAGLIVLSSYDLLAVGTRYLNEDSFVEAADVEGSLNPTTADLMIKNDPDKNFRVFDETGASFESSLESARTSYHHNSIGGYHPAKLGLYQDIIAEQLSKGNMRVYDMLNAKYFITEDPATRQPVARLNPGAYGPCWLVRSIHYVKDGDEEMKALDSINTRDTAIIQEKFQSLVRFQPVPDSTASIRLIDNKNDTVDYKFSAKTNQFAVFSEVYYSKGWNAYLDGQKTDYTRVDYILRGMSVPAGEHTIQFRFEPRSYELGNTLSVWASLIAYLLLIAAIVVTWRNSRNKPSSNTGTQSSGAK
jgi:membrane protein YfhO